MTARRKDLSDVPVSPVDGLLMDRLSVIARNRGMGSRRLGPNRLVYHYCNKYANFRFEFFKVQMLKHINKIATSFRNRLQKKCLRIIPNIGLNPSTWVNNLWARTHHQKVIQFDRDQSFILKIVSFFIFYTARFKNDIAE